MSFKDGCPLLSSELEHFEVFSSKFADFIAN